MKLVSVLHFPEFGGPHNQLLRLSPELERRGVHTISVLPCGPGADCLRSADLDVRRMRLSRIRAVKHPATHVRMFGRLPVDLVRLAALFRRERPNVVQLNGLINPHAAIVARHGHPRRLANARYTSSTASAPGYDACRSAQLARLGFACSMALTVTLPPIHCMWPLRHWRKTRRIVYPWARSRASRSTRTLLRIWPIISSRQFSGLLK